MSFKLFAVAAALAVVSCARLDHDQVSQQLHHQQQQEMVHQQNEQIRDHQRVEHQQRQEQLRDLDNQRRRQEQLIRDQEQLIRDQEQQRRDNIRGNVFFTAQPQFVQSPYHFIVIPSSRRTVELRDDSNYNFNYAVSDLTTGDIKSQQEVRNGDQVQGQYTMMDSDGYQRIVDYRANDETGFDAEVRREPTAAVLSQQLVRVDGTNNYAANFYHQHQPITHYVAAQPTIYSTTSVSRRDDGQRNQYTSTTASNF